jgi:hypothetical protein
MAIRKRNRQYNGHKKKGQKTIINKTQQREITSVDKSMSRLPLQIVWVKYFSENKLAPS